MPSTISARTLLCAITLTFLAVQFAGRAEAAMTPPAEGAFRVAGCGFNERCEGTASAPYHAGIDYAGGTGRIVAVADGPIVAVVDNGNNDHGMGTTVIQQIETAWGVRYAAYSHLARAVRTSGCVARGEQLGVMGGTGYGLTNRWPVHLHFEMKTRAVLHNPSGAGTYWGYMPGPAQNYGFEDPGYWLANVPPTGKCAAPYAVSYVGQDSPPAAMPPGTAFDYRFTWRNNGTETLYNSGSHPARCRASGPPDRSSAWIDTSSPRAIATSGVAIDQAVVRPGEQFTCTLPLRAPSARISQEYFAVVIEGKAWAFNNGVDDVWVRLTSADADHVPWPPSAYAVAYAGQDPHPAAMAPGTKLAYRFLWRNRGTATLYNSGSHPVRCRASRPVDRHSAWIDTSDPRAVADMGVAIDQAVVHPGETFSCTLPLRAPSPRVSQEYFAVVAEGKAWAFNNGVDDVWVRLTSQ